MVETEETIRTGVDNLISLIKNKKEISFDEAANVIGEPVSTIEAWASFLEEEGLVSINYKFTTPYLSYQSPDSIANRENLKRMESQSGEIKNIITLLDDNITKENHEEAHKNISKLQKSLRYLLSNAKNDRTLSKKVNVFSLSQRLESFTNLINHAKSLLQKKDFERLKSAYKHIYQELHGIYKEVDTPLKKVIGEIEEEYKFQDNGKDEISPSLPEEMDVKDVDKYNELIKKAYEYLSSGKLEKVKEIYTLIEKNYHTLPDEFKDKRAQLNDAMLKLNKDLSSLVSKKSGNVIEEKAKKIEELIKKVKEDISDGNFENADNDYKKIEEMFLSLPEGFLEKKIELENEMIDLHSQLISDERDKYSKDMLHGENQIGLLLKQVDVAISKEDINTALSLYEEAKKKFEVLPSGFLGDKIKLQSKMFDVYQKVLMLNKKVSEAEFKKKENQIKTISIDIEDLIKKEDFNLALDYLEKANEIFDTLPDGFLEAKSKMESYLLKLSSKLSQLEKKYTSKEFADKSAKIMRLFNSLDSYVEKKEYDLAKQLYKEIVALYSTLPSGYLNKKVKLKAKILDLYKNLILHSDDEILSDEKDVVKKKYGALLKILISIHEHIEDKDFDLMEADYSHIMELYNSLPIGFVQKRISIRQEILKVYKEVKLYKTFKLMEKHRKNPEELKKVIEESKKIYDELKDDCKEDAELFKFMKQKQDYYSSILNKSYNIKIEKEESKPKEKHYEEKTTPTKKDDVEQALIRKFKIDDFETLDLFEKSLVYFLSEEYDEALKTLRMFVSASSNSSQAHYLMHIIDGIQSQDNKKEGAVENYLTLLKEINKEALATLEAKLARMKLIRSFYEYMNKRYDTALIDLNRIKGYYPNDTHLETLFKILKNTK